MRMQQDSLQEMKAKRKSTRGKIEQMYNFYLAIRMQEVSKCIHANSEKTRVPKGSHIYKLEILQERKIFPVLVKSYGVVCVVCFHHAFISLFLLWVGMLVVHLWPASIYVYTCEEHCSVYFARYLLACLYHSLSLGSWTQMKSACNSLLAKFMHVHVRDDAWPCQGSWHNRRRLYIACMFCVRVCSSTCTCAHQVLARIRQLQSEQR
jgi:hypothetical protein